jgi:hypothetical protein
MKIPFEDFNQKSTVEYVVDMLADNASHNSPINYEISKLHYANVSLLKESSKLEAKLYTLDNFSDISSIKRKIAKIESDISHNNTLIKNKRNELRSW